jgi:hypothetical protein
MVSYNDITKFTYYYENKRNTELLDLLFTICNSKNIIDIFNFLKHERFSEENASIKLIYEESELLIFKEDFLLDIPTPETKTHIIDDFSVSLDYPNIIDYACKPMHCIKSISYNGEDHILNSSKDYNIIPSTLYRKIAPHIQYYIDNLQNIKIYKIRHIESRFFLHIESIIRLIYFAFVSDFRNLVDEKLFLMKEFNFTHEAFDNISFLEMRHYLESGIHRINEINERNNPETRGIR